MRLFDFLNDILYNKSGNLLDKKESESEFNTFLLQRWLSMHSNSNTIILNATVNRLYKPFTKKKRLYQLLLSVLPKCQFKRIRYIKKSKKKAKSKSNFDDAIKFIAQSKQISEREVRCYVEEYGLNLSGVKKVLRSLEK
jgi:hypothetical protein